MNIQDWFPLGLTGLFSLQSKGLSRAFSNTTVQKHHRHKQIKFDEKCDQVLPPQNTSYKKKIVMKRRSREVWKISSKSSDEVNIISNGPNRNYVPSDKIQQEYSIASMMFLPKMHNLKSNHKEIADKLKGYSTKWVAWNFQQCQGHKSWKNT